MEVFVLLFIILAIVCWIVARAMDGDRVKQYVESRGGKLLEKNWAPFGKGWFGEKNDRIYEVRYVDKEGNERRATCKTSLWSGVYWTEDRVVRYAREADGDGPSRAPLSNRAPSLRALEEENRRLREENEKLRRREA